MRRHDSIDLRIAIYCSLFALFFLSCLRAASQQRENPSDLVREFTASHCRDSVSFCKITNGFTQGIWEPSRNPPVLRLLN